VLAHRVDERAHLPGTDRELAAIANRDGTGGVQDGIEDQFGLELQPIGFRSLERCAYLIARSSHAVSGLMPLSGSLQHFDGIARSELRQPLLRGQIEVERLIRHAAEPPGSAISRFSRPWQAIASAIVANSRMATPPTSSIASANAIPRLSGRVRPSS
jgi:hypothetical protein